MGDKTVSVRVRFEGGDQVKAGLQEVGREGTRALQSIGTVSAATGAKLQNAGYQVSDFFVQIAGGTAPSRALAQQMPQLLQGFGLVGVAASVLIAALPSLWSLFSSGAADALSLEKHMQGVAKAVNDYSSAADLAIEPMDRLIAKYGELAGSVREARIQQAELARGDAMRAVDGLLGSTGFDVGGGADLDAIAAVSQDFRAPSEDMRRLAEAAGEVQFQISEIARTYQLTADQALNLAVASDRVRDSAGQGAAEQVAAASALRDYLVEIYGSADAANEATNGLVEALNAAAIGAADVASIDMAGPIGAAAGEAARLADNLLAASRNYGKIQNTGASGPDAARFSLYDLNTVNTTGTLASGAGGVFKPPAVRGGSGGGGADQDIARSIALTESLRSETEKYAIALEEINRLKAKGLITDETYNRQLDKLNEKLGTTGDLGKKAASAIRSAFDGLFDDPAAALKDLAKQLAMMALYAQLAKSFPTIFGGGGLIPLGVPGFAAGGRHRGGLRIVGENGPELEATGPSMIYPADALRNMGRGGGGTSVQVHNYSGGEVETQTRRGPNGQQQVDVMVGKSIGGGRQDGVMRGRFGTRPAAVKR